MNKEDFLEVLRAALHYWDGGDPVKDYQMNPKLANVGIKLVDYLRSKEV